MNSNSITMIIRIIKTVCCGYFAFLVVSFHSIYHYFTLRLYHFSFYHVILNLCSCIVILLTSINFTLYVCRIKYSYTVTISHYTFILSVSKIQIPRLIFSFKNRSLCLKLYLHFDQKVFTVA